MYTRVECWRYPGTDEPSGFCAFKAVCPNKQSFKVAIRKEYGEEYTEDEILSKESSVIEIGGVILQFKE